MTTAEERELARRGWIGRDAVDFVLQTAKFYCPKDWNDLQVQSYGRPKIERWLDGLEREGWTLRDKPIVAKIRCVSEADISGGQFGRDGLWHPSMLFKHHIIPYEHPYVVDRNMVKEDLYMIWAPTVKPSSIQVVERDDAWLEQLVKEDSPLLKGMVF